MWTLNYSPSYKYDSHPDSGLSYLWDMDSGAAAAVAAAEVGEALEKLRESMGLPTSPSRAALDQPGKQMVRVREEIQRYCSCFVGYLS